MVVSYTEEEGSDEESTHTEDGEDIEERPKVKRTRTAYSNYQLDQLELVFSQTHYPDVFLREELSARLGISESRLQVTSCNLYMSVMMLHCRSGFKTGGPDGGNSNVLEVLVSDLAIDKDTSKVFSNKQI